MARNKDVYLQSSGGRWVRYDAAGHIWSRARITATVLDITSTTAPVLSIRGEPYLVITSDSLQERLITKQIWAISFRSRSWRQHRRMSRCSEHVSIYVS